jgi:hypothetical protein
MTERLREEGLRKMFGILRKEVRGVGRREMTSFMMSIPRRMLLG